jgi:hypothetical protein
MFCPLTISLQFLLHFLPVEQAIFMINFWFLMWKNAYNTVNKLLPSSPLQRYRYPTKVKGVRSIAIYG